MSQPTYRINVLFGSIESQQRYIARDGWLQHQARTIEYDQAGLMKHISDWSDCGVRIKIAGEFIEHKPWWRFWK